MSNLFVKTKAGFSGNLYVKVLKPTPQAYTDCLTFTGETSEFALKPQYQKVWDGTLYYSTDHNTWNVWNGEEISSANKKLYLKPYRSNFLHLSGPPTDVSINLSRSSNIIPLFTKSSNSFI